MQYFILIAYIGTNFFGWQKCLEGPSIEGALQKALLRLIKFKGELSATSRTDRGVHARGQLVTFYHSQELDFQKMIIGLNALLDPEIRALAFGKAPLDFHPTLDVHEKEYHYVVDFSPTLHPTQRALCWHLPYPLNLELIQKASLLIPGEHDFKAFCNIQKKHRYNSTKRLISQFTIEERGSSLLFKIKGPAFLYKMVRNLVGTVIMVGRGKLTIEKFSDLLNGAPRESAGPSAPPEGLVLAKIYYSKEWINSLEYLTWTEEMPLAGVEVEKSGKSAATLGLIQNTVQTS